MLRRQHNKYLLMSRTSRTDRSCIAISFLFLFHPASYLLSWKVLSFITPNSQAAMDTAIDRIRREVKVLLQNCTQFQDHSSSILLNCGPHTNAPILQSQKQKSDAMCELKTAHDWQAEKEVG